MIRRPLSIVGVDPGRDGAIVRLQLSSPLVIQYVKLATFPREPQLLLARVRDLLHKWNLESPITEIVLERPFSMPGMGHAIEYGRAFGHLETALMCAHENVSLIYPSQWQPRVFPKVKGFSAKQQASLLFDRLFMLPADTSQHNGVVDAALIAVSRAVELNIMHTFPLINWTEQVPKPKKKVTKICTTTNSTTGLKSTKLTVGRALKARTTAQSS